MRGTSLLRKLGLAPERIDPREEGILEALEDRLRGLGPKRGGFVAAFAALLARVAYADEEISEAEAERMAALVVRQGGLSREEGEVVASIARRKTVALRGAEHYRFTRRLNELASDDEKRHVIDCLYALATTDDLVTHVEDREIRAIAAALLIPSREVLQIRSRYREKLEELKLLRALR